MFFFAILLGIYSYCIFFLGIWGWLYQWVIIGVTIAFVLLSYQVIKSSGHQVINTFKHWLEDLKTFDFRHNSVITLFGLLFALQASVNVIGVMGSELGFDALWYHLTLPKLYLINHSIDFIPGGLLYYSAMPKLAEMLYTAGLAFGNENLVKFIHYVFGLLTCLALYKLSRKFLKPLFALIAVVIFYSNLVVGWESTSAYIDLIRAFFEVMALWAFVEWWESKKRKWLVWSAVMVGLAITTKLLAIGSLVIFSLLIMRIRGIRGIRWIRDLGVFIGISLLVPLPWFIFSYLYTGNPVYPFFSEIYKIAPEPMSLINFVKEVWLLFTQSSDPLSLVYILFLPVGVWIVWRTGGLEGLRRIRGIRLIGVYSLLAIVMWYFTPRTGGGRFILPYLPALSLLCAVCIQYFEKKVVIRNVLLGIVVCASLFSIVYRAGANSKYVPVILGQETKAQFLADHLNFGYGDFYDVDGYFASHITPTDKVLLLGFHNLYYVDFPFVHETWVKEDEKFNFIAVQKGELPEKYKGWKLVYENKQTMVKLYSRGER